MNAEKTTPFVKASDKWGQIFADKEILVSRCVNFGNSISKGKLNFFIV